MRYRHRRRWIPLPSLFGVLWVGVLVGGCTVGPEHARPWTPAEDAAAYAHQPGAAPADDVAPQLAAEISPWWEDFADPATSELVRGALQANTDLRAAAARVLAAQAGLRRARSTRLPEIGVGASATQTRNSFVLPQLGRVTTEATTLADDLTVAYQADLFGGLRRGRQAAWADLLAQDAARRTVAHTVVAETVRGRVRLATLERSLELARAVRDSRRGTLETIDRRYSRGLLPALELRLARENLAAAEDTVLTAEQELARARLALDVLLGRRPGGSEILATGLPPLPDLAPVPLGLPVELLERRPDVRAAEMRLAASTARVGVALADLFPGLTLSGSAGNRSDGLGDLLSSETFVFNVVANLVASIFDGGRRKAAVAVARAQADEAAALYSGAVLGALREVEDALIREDTLRRRLGFLEQRVDEAVAADDAARARYERGVLPLLDVLEIERRRRAAESARLDAQAQVWNARIDLHLALGGDWGLQDTQENNEDAP